MDDLELLVQKGSESEIRDFLKILYPADIADMLEAIEEPGRKRVLGLLDLKTASEVLSEVESTVRPDVIKGIVRERLADIVEKMETDDAADLLMELPAEDAQKVLADMEVAERREVSELLKYPEDTAGGIMQAELVAIPSSHSVSQAIDEIRAKREEVKDLHNVYVVDNENSLMGLVPLRRLILAKADAPLSDIMDRAVMAANVNDDQEHVASMFRKYDVPSLPVVDEGNHLVGRIMHDDIMDVLDEEADEDILRLAGSTEEDVTSLSLGRSVQARFPWLLVTYVGETVTALVIAWFRGAFTNLLLFVPFLPVIVGMAGNVGSQSATIIVRGLATGRVDARKVWQVAYKEVGVGLVLGVIYGVLVGVMTGMHEGAVRFGVIVGSSLMIVVAMAGSLGVLLPIFFHRIKRDPALATAPFIASSMDFLGAAIYYSIAMTMHG